MTMREGFKVNGSKGFKPLIRIVVSAVVIATTLALAARVLAQEAPKSVYVTTQDYSALRAGPGVDFQRITVIPPAVTLPAIGRTADAGWIQVVYNDQHGWIAGKLLIWSGDMMGLPLDGVTPLRFARLKGPTIEVTQDMVIRTQRFAGPGARVQFPVPYAKVEITGRLGSGANYWLQFWYDGQYYWVGNWSLNLGGTGSQFSSLPDGAYTYPYGRVFGHIQQRLDEGINTYNAITNLWVELASGQSISCDVVPEPAKPLELKQADLDSAPIFLPVKQALDTAITHTNNAIASLQTICQGTDRTVTPETVSAAFDELDIARRNFTLARTLMPPIANRDPALGGSGK